MDAVIGLIGIIAILISDSLDRQHGAKKYEDKSGTAICVIIIAFVYAIILDLTE